jgi:hypothetical protein
MSHFILGLHYIPRITQPVLDKSWTAKFKHDPLSKAMECSIPSEFALFMISLTDFEIGKRVAWGSFSDL